MSEKLQNYTSFDIKKRRAILLPHKWILSVLVLFVLILVMISLYTVFEVTSLGTEISGLHQQQKFLKAKIEKASGGKVVARMTPGMLKEQSGFYPYFSYLSSFEYRGVWLNKIEMAFQGGKAPYISMRGDSETPEALRYVLTKLSLSPLFAKPPLRISRLSVLSEKPAVRSRRSRSAKKVEPKGLQKKDLKRLYAFVVTNDSGVKAK